LSALSLKPDLAQAYVAQAVLLEKRRPRDYVAIEARRALTLDPNMVDAATGWQPSWASRAAMPSAAQSGKEPRASGRSRLH
jgi:hypothetical protein